jgi:hypothetical protein
VTAPEQPPQVMPTVKFTTLVAIFNNVTIKRQDVECDI